jgi:hypothetical protein
MNDVVNHRISPDKVSITALDLRPAPQFQIQTIMPIAGQERERPQQPPPQSPEQPRQ